MGLLHEPTGRLDGQVVKDLPLVQVVDSWLLVDRHHSQLLMLCLVLVSPECEPASPQNEFGRSFVTIHVRDMRSERYPRVVCEAAGAESEIESPGLQVKKRASSVRTRERGLESLRGNGQNLSPEGEGGRGEHWPVVRCAVARNLSLRGPCPRPRARVGVVGRRGWSSSATAPGSGRNCQRIPPARN